LEYKVLLLKERTANHITTPEFGFNEDQINQLAEKLTLDNSKIHFIKEFRDLTKLGLKDTKELVESKISQYDFDHTMTFPEARKIILENF
jgi:ribosomal protein L7/L12